MVDHDSIKQNIFKAFSISMILFGLIGASFSAAGIFLTFQYGIGNQIESAAQPVHDNLETVSQTMDDASDAANNAANTAQSTKSTLNTAASTANSVSNSIDSTVGVLNNFCFSELTCPSNTIEDLERYERHSQSFDRDLRSTANNIGSNTQDFREMSDSFEEMSGEVEQLRATVEPATYASAYYVDAVAYLFLGWMMVLHLFIAGIGTAFIRVLPNTE